MNPRLVLHQFGVFVCIRRIMKIRILETRDYRGTIGLRYAGEIIETENVELVKQLEAQGLAVQITTTKEIVNKTIKGGEEDEQQE